MNINLIATPINSTVNYIINGNFSNNTCIFLLLPYCQSIELLYITSFLPGWYPIISVQIAKGSAYNSNFGNIPVIKLVSSSSVCLYQNLSHLPAGIYNLTYTYAAQAGVPLINSAFSIFSNDTQINYTIPSDYLIHKDMISIQIYNNDSNLQIKFCGNNTPSILSGSGALLSQV